MYFTDISYVVHPVGRVTPNGVTLLGTAFFINRRGLLATAAHVTGNNDSGLVIVMNKVSSIQDYQDTSDNAIQCIPAKIKEINPIADVCILEVPTIVQSNFILDSTDSVQVGESIAVFGYPHSDHGRMVLTQQDTSIGAKILIESSGIKLKNIVLIIQSRPGQSGSPIVIPEKRAIAGLLIGSYAPQVNGSISIGGIDPQTLHQTTHAISAEYIKEMLE